MSKEKTGALGGVQALADAIAALGGPRVDAGDFTSGDVDLDRLRREEARLAGREIARQRAENRHKYVSGLYERGQINPAWTFQSLTVDAGNRKAVSGAQGFCRSLATAHSPLLLLVSGPPGTGKTALCHAIANRLLNDSGARHVIVLNFEALRRCRLFSARENYEAAQEKQREWDRYGAVDLLILDGLCGNNEGLSAYDQKNLTELLRLRHSRGLDMTVTTPVSFTQLHAAIGDAVYESLKEYDVLTAPLFGGSRRAPIVVDGVPLI